MPKIISDIIEKLLRYIFEKVGPLIRAIYIFQKIGLLVSTLLLLTSIVLGMWYWKRSADYESIVRDTLWADMESTPQRFKGLEAFIYSNLKQNVADTIDVRTEIIGRPIPNKLIEGASRLQKALQNFLIQEQSPNEKNKGGIPDPSRLAIRVALGNNDGRILTDDIRPGFLFLPVYCLRSALSENELDRLKERTLQARDLTGLIDSRIDSDLRKDIRFTASLAKELQGLTRVPVVEISQSDKLLKFINGYPTQVYVITKNGVNRIFSNQDENPEQYYGSQFSATTFFPSRPYFWPAFQSNSPDGKYKLWDDEFTLNDQRSLGQCFYVTRPYMDLAGNGIVITLSRGILVDGGIQAVLCIDLAFVKTSNSIDTSLRGAIDKLEGKSIQVVCEMFQEGNVDCSQDTRVDKAPLDESQNELILELKSYVQRHSASKERSEIAGNIQVINEGANSNEMHFSVPIAEAKYGAHQQTTTLLLVSLNLFKYKRVTSAIAGLATATFGAMVILLTYFWGKTVRSQKEYQEAFKEVADVMYESPTPYVRLDSKDTIVECSRSFYEKLGYDPDIDNLLNREFRSFCADDASRRQYDTVQQDRRNGKAVDPYRLRLKRKDSRSWPIVIQSAAVPSIDIHGLPETFGILLEDTTAHNRRALH